MRKRKRKDPSIMPFGKHKGKHLPDVPASYLISIGEQPFIEKWPHVYNYIQANEWKLREKAETEKNSTPDND